MPTKIRLQRRGRKARPFYHIVIADGRAPRDGKFIEKIGTYNPITEPADIQLNFDRALYWLQTGAQPTDTVRTILSYKGVMYKNHLLKGVKKGAFTEEQAEVKFQTWLTDKEAKIENKLKESELAKKEAGKIAFEAEKLVKENRAKDIAAKRAAAIEKEVDAAKEVIAAEAGDDTASTDAPAEVEAAKAEPAEEVKAEAPAEEAETKEEPAAEEKKAEEVKEEAAEEPKAEEAKEEVKEEPKAEPKAEEVKTEKPAAKEEKEEEKVEETKEEEPKAEKKEEAKKEEKEEAVKAEAKEEEAKEEKKEEKKDEEKKEKK